MLEAFELALQDRTVWRDSGSGKIIAPFNGGPAFKDQMARVEAYSRLTVAYIAMHREWPPKLSPLLILALVVDAEHQSTKHSNTLPFGLIAKVHPEAAQNLQRWYSYTIKRHDLRFGDPVTTMLVENFNADVSNVAYIYAPILTFFYCFRRLQWQNSSNRNESITSLEICSRENYLESRNT